MTRKQCSVVLMKGWGGRVKGLTARCRRRGPGKTRTDVVESFLERGEDINKCNASNEFNKTPLDRAAAKGKVDVTVARALIKPFKRSGSEFIG